MDCFFLQRVHHSSHCVCNLTVSFWMCLFYDIFLKIQCLSSDSVPFLILSFSNLFILSLTLFDCVFIIIVPFFLQRWCLSTGCVFCVFFWLCVSSDSVFLLTSLFTLSSECVLFYVSQNTDFQLTVSFFWLCLSSFCFLFLPLQFLILHKF